MVLTISAAVAAAAFVVLTVYVILFLRTASQAVREIEATLTEARAEVEAVGRKSVSLMETAERLLTETERWLEAFDPLAAGVRTTGEAFHQTSESAKRLSEALARSAGTFGSALDRNAGRFSDAGELVSLGLQLWRKWQLQRSAGKSQLQSMEDEEDGR